MSSGIDAKRLNDIFVDSLFRADELESNYPESEPSYGVEAQAVMATFMFHPARLDGHRDEVMAMLKELPDEFMAGSGEGGWSFLQACMDRHRNHWGEHRNVEQLLAMGVGLGYVRWLLPRQMWAMLPGGMPYLSVDLSAGNDLSDKIEESIKNRVRRQYTREQLIQICERAIVPESKWRNRDSQQSQAKVGMAWALLKAGCAFRVLYNDGPDWGLNTDDDTIWIEIESKGFNWFETHEDMEEDSFYLPTPENLNRSNGGDWY